MNYARLKFLIYISHSYSIPIGEPLEDVAKQRGHDVKWFADKPEGSAKIKHRHNAFKNIEEAVNFKPDIVLAITNQVPSFISGIKVQVFHGFNAQKRTSKRFKYSHFKIRGMFDLYCTQGPSTTKPFKKLQQQFKHFEVKETGWSKLDPLFKSDNQKIKAEKVLITSTFTKSLSLAHNVKFFKEVKKLIETKKYQFLMTTHPKMNQDIINKWKSLQCENFEYQETYNLLPLYQQSKLMVSDTTSAIQEFLQLKRPIIAINNPNSPNYVHNLNDSSHLEKAIDESNKWFTKLRSEVHQSCQLIHPFTDGRSSQRVIDACEEFIKNMTKLKPKPLKILRKLKLRKALNYWKL